MTNLNKNELSSRTNLRNLTSTAKAGLHNAATYPRKRYSLLALLLLGLVLCAANLLAVSSARRTWQHFHCASSIHIFMLGYFQFGRCWLRSGRIGYAAQFCAYWLSKQCRRSALFNSKRAARQCCHLYLPLHGLSGFLMG